MARDITYLPYRHAGYTDDLGIIADQNQYIKEQPSGWHVVLKPNEWPEIREWLDNNNIWHETYYSCIVLKREEDVVLFSLRWA